MKYITTGIDIGTHSARLCVISHDTKAKTKETLTCLKINLDGMHDGHIYNKELVKKSLNKLISEANKNIQAKIDTAVVSFSGSSLVSSFISVSSVIAKANNEITTLDIETLDKNAEESAETSNHQTLHQSCVEYKIDGKVVTGRVEGMSGIKIECKKLFVRGLTQHIEQIEEIFVELDVDVINVAPKAIPGSQIGLNEKQKMVGVGYLDIGADTSTLVVYENNVIIGYNTMPIGSSDITNDVALGLKVSLEEAELIKLGSSTRIYPRKKVEDIIAARIDDISELVNNYLKKIKRHELLPGGICITGGGSELPQIETRLRETLKLPIKKVTCEIQTTNKGVVRNPEFLECYSLALLSDTLEENGDSKKNQSPVQRIKKSLNSFFKQFLP